jgi:hypothetical protein
MIEVMTWPEESSRTPQKSCYWVAETTIDGIVYRARSRQGAANELARTLIAAGVADAPMETYLPPAERWGPCARMGWGSPGMRLQYFGSLYRAAGSTHQESATRSVHREQYVPPDEIAAARAGKREKRGESGSGVPEYHPSPEEAVSGVCGEPGGDAA